MKETVGNTWVLSSYHTRKYYTRLILAAIKMQVCFACELVTSKIGNWCQYFKTFIFFYTESQWFLRGAFADQSNICKQRQELTLYRSFGLNRKYQNSVKRLARPNSLAYGRTFQPSKSNICERVMGLDSHFIFFVA